MWQIYQNEVESQIHVNDTLREINLIKEEQNKEARNNMMTQMVTKLNALLKRAKHNTDKKLAQIHHFTKRNEWWSEELDRLKLKKWAYFVLYKQFKTEEFKDKLAKARREFKKQIKVEKVRVENERARRLNMKFCQNRILYYKIVKKMRQETIFHTVDF